MHRHFPTSKTCSVALFQWMGKSNINKCELWQLELGHECLNLGQIRGTKHLDDITNMCSFGHKANGDCT